MISAIFGHFFDKPLSKITKKVKLNPNLLTILGFLTTIVAAFIIPINLKLGGILIAVGSIFDMLDGVFARTTGRVTRFGAFLDSVLDRYSDAFIFIGLALYFLKKIDHISVFVCLLVLTGSFLISYTRARAEGLGESCNVGIMERPERVILLVFATITGWLKPVLWIMLVLTHITVFQRMHHVWKIMNKTG
jgi:phosphatidylglycerophosphate synthase